MNANQLFARLKLLIGRNFKFKISARLVHKEDDVTVVSEEYSIDCSRNILDEMKRIRQSQNVKFNRVTLIIRLARDYKENVISLFEKVSSLLIRFRARVDFVTPTAPASSFLVLQKDEQARGYLVVTVTRTKPTDDDQV